MGVAKRGLKKFKEAEEWYRKAVELDKKDPRPWYNLAVLNQDHLIGQDDVEQPQIEEFYNVAKKHCGEFNKIAEGNKKYAVAVKDCLDRIAIIDDAIQTFRVMEELEKKAAALAEQEKKAEDERRKKLLEMEKQAAAAGTQSPTEAADAAAAAEAAAAKAEEKSE
jgi:TPR repeat protein